MTMDFDVGDILEWNKFAHVSFDEAEGAIFG